MGEGGGTKVSRLFGRERRRGAAPHLHSDISHVHLFYFIFLMGFQKCRLVNEFLTGTDIVLMCMSARECVLYVCVCVSVLFTCMDEEMQMCSTEWMHATNRVRGTKSGYEFSLS